jgi:hypothetical protein
MRRPTKIALWIASPFVLLLIGFLLIRFVIFDWEAKPFCHKQITLGLMMLTNDQASALFPNIEGSSLRSMETMADVLIVTNLIFPDYNYIPGLRGDDPNDLVLFYFNRPTRWRLHVKPETRWTAKTWIVLPINPYVARFGDEGRGKRIGSGPRQIRGYGEESESLTTEQFTNRLIATLDFLRTNNRPHWQEVVKEHTAFLQSVPR